MVVSRFCFPTRVTSCSSIVGFFLWEFFAEGTKTGLASLHAKAFLFKKMRVPLWVVVLGIYRQPAHHPRRCSAS